MLHERDELMQQHHRNPAGTTEKMARQQQQLENKLKSKTEEIQVIMSQKRELQRTVEGLRSTSTRISRLTDEIQEMKQQRVSLQRSVEQAQRQHKQELEEKRKEIQQLQRQTRQQTRQITELERSNSKSDSLLRLQMEQTAQLRQEGYRELVFTGIEISSWGHDLKTGETLIDLLEAVSAAAGDMRLRLGSLEPRTITEDFCRRASKLPNLCPHFHLSLQSGSDAVLKRMKRRYTSAEYLALVEKLRNVFPGCAITTDIMVGFPGETDEEFAESMAFAEKVGFAKIHVFPYSIRKGTVAAMRTNQVVPQVKSARAKEMSALADRLERQFLESQVGTVQTVLIEKRTSPDYCNGFTGSYIPVRIYGEDIPRHSLVQVKLTSADGNYCTGTTKF